MAATRGSVQTTMNDAQVLGHLMFHKSLLSDDDEAERINKYLQIVKESDRGDHVSITDPFDRAIAMTFELVLEEHMDPWDIDLVKFANLYLERVKESAEVDLLTAGRLLVMAWSILKMQSEDLRAKSEPPEPEPEAWDAAWDALPDAEWLTDDVDYAYTTAVVREPKAPLDEKIRHKADRRVTLMELMNALEDARVEAEERARLVADRDAERARRRAHRSGSVQGQVHKEDQEAEIHEVWTRIARFNGHPIPMTDLREKSRDDVVKTLVSCLFLARQQRVKLWQEEFPFGAIYVQNTHRDEDDGDAEASTEEVETDG